MHARTRLLFPFVAVAAASVVMALALLRLSIPAVAQWFTEVPPGILDRLIDPVPSALLSLVVGLLGVVVGLRALALERSGSRPPQGILVAAAVVGIGIMLLAPGGGIPVAGYMFAIATVGLSIVGVALLAVRRPLVGSVGIALISVLVFIAVRFLDGLTFLPRVLAALVAQLPFVATTAAYIIVTAALVLWAIGAARAPHGRFAAGVLRHRSAITIVAAACALPYAAARASWLTRWPQFGGSAEMFAAEPAVLLTGVLLGIAMLTGGYLTLGLIRPWGERFSPKLAAIGGRPVPVGLAVIPATVVAVLFFTSGFEFLLHGFAGNLPVDAETLVLALMLPFWLWGPLLGLAAWGYAMKRESASNDPDLALSIRPNRDAGRRG